MANSRYDYFKVWDGSSFIIPNQVRVWNGSSWVDIGTKDSYSLKKINVFNGTTASSLVCATCRRQDYDYPGYIEIGTSKYIDLKKANGSWLNSDWKYDNSTWNMKVIVNDSTPLYTSYCNNQGDIYEAFVNILAVVNGNKVYARVESYYYGLNANDAVVQVSANNDLTNVQWDKGQQVEIAIKLVSNKLQLTVNGVSQTVKLQHHIIMNPRFQKLGSKSSKIGKKSSGSDVSSSQSTYGNARISTFSTNNYYGTYNVNFETATNGATNIQSTGTLNSSASYNPAYAETSGTSVTRTQYTEYIRQTVN